MVDAVIDLLVYVCPGSTVSSSRDIILLHGDVNVNGASLNCTVSALVSLLSLSKQQTKYILALLKLQTRFPK